MTFEELGLEPKLLRAIIESGYETPTPIQEAAIPDAIKGRDVLGIAQTGTGKTASFTLPMIHRLSQGRAKARMPRSLVLAPTRELAAQVAENFEKYGKYHKLTMALLIGGVSFAEQDAKLTRGVDVLIATPGRLLDHHERGKLLLTGVQIMVVDEADRMLDMGFIPDIERIFKLTPFTRQTLFFSATMPPEIQKLTDQFLSAPLRIEVSRPASAAPTITQNIIRLPSGNDKLKRAALRHLIETSGVKNGIVFCNRKKTVDIVAKSLQKHGANARPIHGDLPQSYRMETLAGFREGKIELLIASDVAARGLDIPDVSHVFNFDVPIHSEDYVHRIGRTGRAGREGTAYMLVGPNDDKYYAAILKTIDSKGINEIEIEDFLKNFDMNSLGKSRTRFGDKPRGRGRDRGERDSKKRSGRDRKEQSVEAKPEADDNPKSPETKSGDSRPQQAKNEEKPRKSKKKEGKKRGDNDKGQNRDQGAAVGFGDHMPAFMGSSD